MRSDARFLVAIAMALGLTLWASLAVSASLAWHFSLLVYFIASFATSADLVDFSVRIYLRQASGGSGSQGWRSPTSVGLDIGRYTPYQRRVHLRPYAFIVSVHNAEAELDDFMERMAPYREVFWIVDDGSTDRTCQILRRAGWRCVEGGKNRKKPAALRFLLTTLPAEIETVVVLDPDFSIQDLGGSELSDLETVIFEFQRSGMAAVCPRIAIRRDGLLSRFQSLEYHMSFALGRRSLGALGVNSGTSIYKRSALEDALTRHSLSVYGEDFQTSVILLGEGHQIYYDGRLVFETDGKRRWTEWFSQRVGWYFGLISVYARHLPTIWRVTRRSPTAAYHFGLYTGVLVLLLHPLRVAALAVLGLSTLNGLDLLLALDWIPDLALTDPIYMAAVLGTQTGLAAVALFIAVPRGERLYLAPVVPLYAFYALAHVVPVTVGYLNWLSLRTVGARVWGDHYQDEASLRAEMARGRPAATS